MVYPAIGRWVPTRRCWCPDVACHVAPRYLLDDEGNKVQPLVEIICPSMPSRKPNGAPYKAGEHVPGGRTLWASHPAFEQWDEPPATRLRKIKATPSLRYGENTHLPPGME